MNNDDALLRAPRLTDIAAQLETVIEEFIAFGVKIPENSRLPSIARLLHTTGAAGVYPHNQERLSLIAEAIRDAQEFINIADVLPKAPFASVRHDLQAAVGGVLRPVSKATGAHLQYQSQLWTGAMLANSGTPTGVLIAPGNGRSPDFFIDDGTLRYAVEVKRPCGDVRNVVHYASAQLRNKRVHGGLLVVDVTDQVEPVDRFRCAPGPADFSRSGTRAQEVLRQLHGQVYDIRRQRIRPGREHIFGIVVFVRAAHWNTTDLSFPYLNRSVFNLSYVKDHRPTLRVLRARKLVRTIHIGIEATGYEPSSEEGLDI
jgi:hypothetical protein